MAVSVLLHAREVWVLKKKDSTKCRNAIFKIIQGMYKNG
jgi:hypothetical protein